MGKTTTAINLGTALAAIDKKVLLIDLDPQGNLSTGIGISEKQRKQSVYNLIVQTSPIHATIQKTKIPNLKIIPSNINLSGIEFELANDENKTEKLTNKINDLKEEHDFILIDCPPSLGILTVNSLVASNSVIVPLQCEFFALEGASAAFKNNRKGKRKSKS